jgi:selenocysteine lyase/cysteine desulfurase
VNNSKQGAPDVAALRRELPVLERIVYLNSGTAGIAAADVMAKLREELSLFEAEGEVRYHEMQERMDAARARVATLNGAGADEVTFIRNAADSVNLVAWGCSGRRERAAEVKGLDRKIHG